jgi:tetratricopeptide (TPR) repeat protein
MKILLFMLCPLFCAGQQLQQLYSEATSAYKAKDYKLFYSKIKEANGLHPYHQGIQYQVGLAAALNGNPQEAITFLKKAILTNANFVVDGNQYLKSISETKEFKSLLELQKKLKQATTQSDTAFVINDRQLHAEGIDYHKKEKSFYIGSIHKRKVVRVDMNGVATDFCTSAFEGMTSVFGLRVDTKRNLLWVCSSPMPEMQNFDSTLRSSVFKFDLKSGKLIQKYQANASEPDGIFGDLTLNSKGEPFISDSKNNKIFIVNESTGKLESIFSSDEFWNIQGLAFSGDEKSLFISDYVKGIFKLNLSAKTLDLMKCSIDVSLKGIDGLYRYKNSLIAIQNGVNPFRLTQLQINKEGTTITSSQTLENNHQAFGEPTLGTLQENTLYYIANSQWGGYDKEHKLKPVENLQDIVVLSLKLK